MIINFNQNLQNYDTYEAANFNNPSPESILTKEILTKLVQKVSVLPTKRQLVLNLLENLPIDCQPCTCDIFGTQTYPCATENVYPYFYQGEIFDPSHLVFQNVSVDSNLEQSLRNLLFTKYSIGDKQFGSLEKSNLTISPEIEAGDCICSAGYTGKNCNFCLEKLENGEPSLVYKVTSDMIHNWTDKVRQAEKNQVKLIDPRTNQLLSYLNYSCYAKCYNHLECQQYLDYDSQCVNNICQCSGSFFGPVCEYKFSSDSVCRYNLILILISFWLVKKVLF